MPKYRFYIEYRGELEEVYPHYNDSFTSSAKREEDKHGIYDPAILQVESTFTFVRQDVDFIKSSFGINEEIPFKIYKSVDNGVTYNKIFDCYFYKLDCEFDDDDRKIIVKPKTETKYRKILAELDTEFDLIELGVEKTTIKYDVRPIVQVYVRGSDKLTSYTNGTYEEEEVLPELSDATLTGTYGFTELFDGFYVIGDGQISPDVSGFYSGAGAIREDGLYQIVLISGTQYGIVEVATSTTIFESSSSPNINTDEVLFTRVGDASQTTISIPVNDLYIRALSPKEVVDSVTLSPIPANDISSPKDKLKYILPITSITNAVYSEERQTEPSFFGQFSLSGNEPSGFTGFFNGQYFKKPTTAGSLTAYPVAKDTWHYFSVWIYFGTDLVNILDDARLEFTDANAMQFHHVMSRILSEVDSSLTFDNTAASSDFLYNASNPLRPQRLYPIITPKTNILFGNYDQAAQTAKVKLSELFEFCKNTYYNFWFIDDSNRLRIEHERFFHKGGSYTTDTVGIDLTTETEPKTLKTWGYKTNKYRYDRTKIPQQIRFDWMDDVSKPFEGYPIDVVVQGLKDGTIEDRNTSRFTTDIDFAISQPNDINKDGFFWLEADLVSSEYVLPYVSINFGVNLEYNLQNGYLANVWLIPNYHKDNLPVNGIFVNENQTTATSVKRTRLQKVIYPDVSINYLNLIRTSLGEGLAREITVNHLNNTVEIEVEHDIE